MGTVAVCQPPCSSAFSLVGRGVRTWPGTCGLQTPGCFRAAVGLDGWGEPCPWPGCPPTASLLGGPSSAGQALPPARGVRSGDSAMAAPTHPACHGRKSVPHAVYFFQKSVSWVTDFRHQKKYIYISFLLIISETRRLRNPGHSQAGIEAAAGPGPAVHPAPLATEAPSNAGWAGRGPGSKVPQTPRTGRRGHLGPHER